MTYGTLAVNVIRVDNMPVADEDTAFSVRIRIGKESKAITSHDIDAKLDHMLNFDVNVNGSEEVFVEILSKNSKPLFSSKTSIASFTQGHKHKELKLKSTANGKKKNAPETTVTLVAESTFTPKGETQKYLGQDTAKAAAAASAMAMGNPQHALAVAPTHRPWFMRAAYYYDTTKHVYNYTTSFRVISRVARLTEQGANMVLQRVSGKTLSDLDQTMLVPTLTTLDDKVDETITTVLTKLVQGQNYVLQKKDEVVETASNVAHKSTVYIKQKKDDVVGTAANLTSKSTTTIAGAYTTTMDNVKMATNYTTGQLSNATSTILNTVRGTATSVVSHVPYLGAKLRA